MDFDWVHRDPSFFDDKAKVFNFRLYELALFGFEVQVIGAEKVKDLTNNFAMILKGAGCCNAGIIHVDNKVAGVDQIAENNVHHPLEGGRGIGHAKEHYQRFESTKGTDKRGFVLVAFADADIGVSPADVKLCETRGPQELVDRVWDQG